jgi:hypothetical protein
MNIRELKEILNQHPDDMEIWVSDRGRCEGGERLVTVKKMPAYNAALDGDEILDEYIYVDDGIDIEEYEANGYLILEDGEILSKEINLI